jgi:hypothetical protein
MNDLKQTLPTLEGEGSEPGQSAFEETDRRRSVHAARVWNCPLAGSWISMIWSRFLSNTYGELTTYSVQ